MNRSTGEGLRSPRSVALLVVALLTSLVLGIAFLVINERAVDAVTLDGEPLPDAQAVAQVVDAAKEIVDLAQLEEASGAYAFLSCKNGNEPPYQVAVYMSFRVPQTNSVKYLGDIAASMVTSGWSDAPSTGEHFGHKLTKGGVTSVFYLNLDDAGSGTMRLYGGCRVSADHRHDDPVWIEITRLS